MRFELHNRRIVGPTGELLVPAGDEITPRLIMLLEGECDGLGASRPLVSTAFPGNGIINC